MLKLEVKEYLLDFKFKAITSRGEMKDRKVWFLFVSDDGKTGIGEVAPINRLSPEDPSDVPEILDRLKQSLGTFKLPNSENDVYDIVQNAVPLGYPSIAFGLEMALLDWLNGGQRNIFSTDFKKIEIPINGLIWMGDEAFMKEQIKEKLDGGFNCIKLKIGSLDFETEKAIIKGLREVSNDLVIRLDANGAFATNEVLLKLRDLSKFNIHSIEQPILPTQLEAMELICRKSEIPIALDEELINHHSQEEKMSLIQEIKPHFLVLKPTLLGGFEAVRNWIDLAEIHGIGWWITSYLESNIGLNAIAQFLQQYPLNIHHGLGTGELYTNNIPSPLQIQKGNLSYSNKSWDLSLLKT